MAEKSDDETLPPSYINLGFEADIAAGPSAPKSEEEYDFDEERKEIPVPLTQVLELREEPRVLTCSCTPALMFEDIYEVCMQYVKKHFCYGSKFVRQMKLIEIDNSCIFHYILESFGEKRQSANSFTSYQGQYIDDPQNGPPPDPWSMNVEPPALFKNAHTRMEIPHTARVIICGECQGSRKVLCGSCSGLGKNSCSSCSGSGYNHDRLPCSSCSGSGIKTCHSCFGSGRVKCNKCSGCGRIKCCKMLFITWTNHLDEFTSNTSKLPTHKIRKATGECIFFEEENKLLPIVNAPDASVNVVSTSLIRHHASSFPGELIIKQRHTLRAVPFTTVKYQWKTIEDEFYVYGKEKDVYFETYPQPCCCCTCC